MNETERTLEFLLELNQKAFYYLLGIYPLNPLDKGRMIVPKYKTDRLRVSEQELRFAYTSVIECGGNSQPFWYSVETPTIKEYIFKGSVNPRSAMTDLALYKLPVESTGKQEKPVKVCNLECKAHNPEKDSVLKDIKKLVGEEGIGAWGHLLINTYRDTLETLFGKIIDSFSHVLNGKDKPFDKHYFFAIHILERKIMITRKILPGELPQGVFKIDYDGLIHLEPHKYVGFDNGWQADVSK